VQIPALPPRLPLIPPREPQTMILLHSSKPVMQLSSQSRDMDGLLLEANTQIEFITFDWFERSPQSLHRTVKRTEHAYRLRSVSRHDNTHQRCILNFIVPIVKLSYECILARTSASQLSMWALSRALISVLRASAAVSNNTLSL
jgi:hypothetical protein